MLTRFLGPAILLAAIVIGDRIRINRPDHKFRLTVEIDTPAGLRTMSGVYAVHPDRGYTQGNTTTTKGDALAADIGGKSLVLLMAHDTDGKLDLDDFNFVAVRAFTAAGQRAAFKRMDRVTGAVPVTGPLMPAMAMVSDRANPATMVAAKPTDLAVTFGAGISLRAVRVEIVPNGIWPLDFGGALGEPATRGITQQLPWADMQASDAAAIRATGWTLKPGDAARMAFTR